MDQDFLKTIAEIISSQDRVEKEQVTGLLKVLLEDAREEVQKAKKASVLYVIKPNTEYQCKDCPLFQEVQQKCWIHGKDEVIRDIGSCGFWLHGSPLVQIQNLGQLGLVNKQESGYEENKEGFSCKRCEYFAGPSYGQCKKVDEKSPGDTPGLIHSDACCNAWDKK